MLEADEKECLYQFLKLFLDLEEHSFRTLARWQLEPAEEASLWQTLETLGYGDDYAFGRREEHAVVRAAPAMKIRDLLVLLGGHDYGKSRSLPELRSDIPNESVRIIFNAEFLKKDTLEEIRYLSERDRVSFLLISIRDLDKVVKKDSDLFLFKTVQVPYHQFQAGADLVMEAIASCGKSNGKAFRNLLELANHVGNRDRLGEVFDGWVEAMKIAEQERKSEPDPTYEILRRARDRRKGGRKSTEPNQ